MAMKTPFDSIRETFEEIPDQDNYDWTNKNDENKNLLFI